MNASTCFRLQPTVISSADGDDCREAFLRRVALRLLKEGDIRRGNLFLRAADDRRPVKLDETHSSSGR